MRTVLIYLALVGLPTLGVFALLHQGRELSAPLAIGGLWTLHAPGPAAPHPCILAGRETPLRVAQSGRWATLELGEGRGVFLDGRLSATRLEAEGEVPARAGCPGGTLRLTASVAGGLDRRTLDGSLSHTGCPGCAPAQVRAERVAEAP